MKNLICLLFLTIILQLLQGRVKKITHKASYNCIFTGKEVFSDTCTHQLVDDFVWKVEGKYVSTNPDVPDEDYYNPVHCNILESYHLEEALTITTEAEFKKAIKIYVVHLIEKLKSNPSRLAIFKAKIPTYSNLWLADFIKGKLRVFVTQGDGYDAEGTLIFVSQDVTVGEEKVNDKCEMNVLADSLRIVP